jgi:sodium transport system permease protein
MRPRVIVTIFRKELREALRDRRTLFMMIGLPIFLYPMLMMLMGRLQEGQEAAQTARSSKIAVWGRLPAGLEERIRSAKKIEMSAWTAAPEAVLKGFDRREFTRPPTPPMEMDAKEEPPQPKKIPDTPWAKAAQQAILDRQADAVLIAWPGMPDELAAGRLGVVTILYDSVRPESQKARDRVNDQLRLFRAELLKEREAARKLEPGFTTGLELQSQNVATEQRRSGMLVGMILPYMLIMFSALSGFYAAIDMTAGEKERGTMQTLLCAPLEPLEIITGKFLAVWSVTMAATVVNLLSLSMTFARLKLIPGMTMKIEPASYFVAFLMLVPISMMVNAIFLAVGAFAKDYKDGQNFLTPLLMGLIVPLMITMMPGVELNGYLAFVPVVNIALLIKGVFLGEWHADMLFLVMLSSAAYASLALVFAAQVFERTNVLLGGKEGFGGVLDFSRRPGSRPSPATSFLVFAVGLVAAFYGSLSLDRLGVKTALPIVEFGFFLLPAVALAWAKGFNLRETFRLRPLAWQGWAGAILVGISGWTVAGGLLVRLLPPPESLRKAMEKILMLEDKAIPQWEVWVFIALIPALCEEAFFRGLILSGFRRFGQWPAILLTGLLFGLAHASVYRLLPTMFLGVVFGYAVWRTRSLAAGILCHLLNNGLMVTLTRSKPLMSRLGWDGARYLPWPAIVVGTVVLAAGLLLMSRTGNGDAVSTES